MQFWIALLPRIILELNVWQNSIFVEVTAISIFQISRSPNFKPDKFRRYLATSKKVHWIKKLILNNKH